MNKEALKNLGSFTGTENWHQVTASRRFLVTDGVKFLAENADCFWFLDIIWSFLSTCSKDETLSQIQFWHLRPYSQASKSEIKTRNGVLATLNCEGTPQAYVTCDRDEGDTAIVQYISMTDFPFDVLPEVKLYVQRNETESGQVIYIACLPSEY